MKKYQQSATRLNWTQYVIDSYTDIRRVAAEGDPSKLINIMEVFSCSMLALGLAEDQEYEKEEKELDAEKEQQITIIQRGNPNHQISNSQLMSILVKFTLMKLRLTSKFLSRCGIAPEKEIELELDQGVEDVM